MKYLCSSVEERAAFNRVVAGSIPATSSKKKIRLKLIFFFFGLKI
jgi:hypothetical protein